MKLKKIAAAALMAAGALPAMAAIGTGDAPVNTSELFFVLYDQNGSFAQDLGMSLDSFLVSGNAAAGLTQSFNIPALGGAAFTQYSASDSNLLDGTQFTNTRWAVLAVDNDGFPAPDDIRLATTLFPTVTPAALQNGDFVAAAGLVADRVANANFTGTHTADIAVNGSSFNPKGTQAYWGDMEQLGTASYWVGNPVGSTSKFYYDTVSDADDSFAPITARAFGNDASTASFAFNGSTLSFSLAPVVTAPVPEPGSLAMLLAGLSAVGFVGARRRRQG